MTVDVINDLKQFIATTVSQTVSQQLTEKLTAVEQRLDAKLEALEARIGVRIETQIKELSLAVAEALEVSHKQPGNHDRRITRLESQTFSATP